MTKTDKKFLFHFLLRTSMYVNPVTMNSIVSFITGYEIGRKRNCFFTERMKELLKRKYKMQYLSDGWPGQIKRLSIKTDNPVVHTFKRIAIEAIVKDGFDKEVTDEMKARLQDIILNLVESPKYPFDNSRWEEEWQLLSFTKEKWFKGLWTKKELDILDSIDTNLNNGTCFFRFAPTESLILLKKKFMEINQG